MTEAWHAESAPAGRRSAVDRILGIVDGLTGTIGRIASLLIVVATAIVLYEVVMRYAFSSPTIWVNETSQIMFGFYFLLGGAYTLLEGGHVRVDLIHQKVSPTVASWLNIFAYIITLFYVSVLLWISTGRAIESINYMEQAESAWSPYIWPVISTVPIAAALLILQALALMLREALTLYRNRH